MKIIFVYITTKNKAEARKIGNTLLGERLAACVNIIDDAESLYWWKGKIQNDKEAILIAKTKESLARDLVKKVKEIHSYSLPDIVVLPILGGSREYLSWIGKETK